MTLARMLAACLAFLLLAMLSIGIYLYRDYPQNLESALLLALQPYGISELSLTRPALDAQNLDLDTLTLAGARSELSFAITLEGLVISYHWRELLNLNVRQVEIERLSIEVTGGAPGESESSAPINLADLLPGPLLAQLPLGEIIVHNWDARLRLGQEPVTAAGELVYRANRLTVSAGMAHLGARIAAELVTGPASEFLLEVNLDSGSGSVAHAVAVLTDAGAEAWRWGVNGNLQHERALELLRSEQLQGWLPASLQQLPALELAGNTQLELSLSHPPTWPLPSAPSSPLGIALQASVAGEHSLEKLALPPKLAVQDTVINTTVELGTDTLRLQVAPVDTSAVLATQESGLSSAQLSWLGWKSLPPVTLSLTRPLHLHWDPGSGELVVPPLPLALSVGDTFSRLRLDVTALSFKVGTTTDSLSAAADGSLRMRLRREALPALAIQFNLDGPSSSTSVALAVQDVAQSLALSGSGVFDRATGAGRFKLALRTPDLPYASSSITKSLAALDLMTAPLAITKGGLRWDATFNTTGPGLAGARQSSEAVLEAVDGKFGEYSFAGLDAQFAWRGIEQWQSTRPATITLASVDAGFAVSDVSTQFDLPSPTEPLSPTVRISRFSADVFGGQVYLPEAETWQVGAAANTLKVNASNWQLGQLVALQQGQDIEARGLLEGELPLLVEDGRIIIERGFLRAIPPGGSIRYRADDGATALANSNEQLGVALDLLEDFHFKVLSTDVQLDKAGNLVLGLALSGTNPTRFDGRQVNFNINLEQNLDPLLQSLRLSDTLVDKLEKRIR